MEYLKTSQEPIWRSSSHRLTPGSPWSSWWVGYKTRVSAATEGPAAGGVPAEWRGSGTPSSESSSPPWGRGSPGHTRRTTSPRWTWKKTISRNVKSKSIKSAKILHFLCERWVSINVYLVFCYFISNQTPSAVYVIQTVKHSALSGHGCCDFWSFYSLTNTFIYFQIHTFRLLQLFWNLLQHTCSIFIYFMLLLANIFDTFTQHSAFLALTQFWLLQSSFSPPSAFPLQFHRRSMFISYHQYN